MSYGWLFENPDDEISGDIYIDLEHLTSQPARTGRHFLLCCNYLLKARLSSLDFTALLIVPRLQAIIF